MRTSILAVAAIAAEWFVALASAQPTYQNVPYATTHDRQKLDLYIPSGQSPPRPVVVWIHGGAWLAGDKSSASGKAPALMNLGFTVAGINYRLSQHATWPAQSHDCKAAIRFLRAHAKEYNLDPARVGVWGSSAGGHLVAFLGTSGGAKDLEGNEGGNLQYSSRVQATADYFGPTDFFTMGGTHNNCDSPESKLLGICLGDVVRNQNDPNWAEEVAFVKSAGPYYFVTSEDTPFHIAHGTADTTVPPGQSQQLYDALVAANVPATLRLVPGAGHGLPPSEDEYVRQFFVRYLGTAIKPGDTDCDGNVNFADINPFVLALTGETEYLRQFPRCSWYAADVDANGLIDFADIGPFVDLLSGGW